MVQEALTVAPLSIDEAELRTLALVADRLLAGRPLFIEGPCQRKHKQGRGLEFLDFQPYQPGSDARMVDWRATARTGDPIVRRFQDESLSEWYVCVDRSASMSVSDGRKWALTVQLAIALLFLLLHRGNRAGLLIFSTDVDGLCRPGRGPRQLLRAVSLLARTRPRATGGGSNLMACARHIKRRRSAVVASDFLTADAMQPGLDRLVQLGGAVHAIQVLSPDDRQLPAAGHVLLRDIESDEQLVLDTDGPQSEAATGRLERLRADLAGYCRRHGIAFTTCDVGQSWQAIIIRHLTGGGAGRA
jgi:uncharacterized protein (DUF58 family)